VEVVPANNDGSVHLGTMACSSNNPASDGNSSSEWALLVNVGPCTRIEIKHLLTLARNILQTHQVINQPIKPLILENEDGIVPLLSTS